MRELETADVVVVGGGAAGLATAIFAARAASDLRICCLDGARRLGAKILVSGGSRCNVTNRIVTEADFWGGSSRLVKRVLQAFPAQSAAAFFLSLGVPLHEEEDGKLFPDTNRSRTVLDALLQEAGRLGIAIRTGERVATVDRSANGFVIATEGGARYASSAAVLATGGRSLPKTGSDGLGYELARRLGHGHVETTPALVPLLLDGGLHPSLSGVSHQARLTVWVDRRQAIRLDGSMLWTHFGISGPVVLNASRHWHRAQRAGAQVGITLDVLGGVAFDRADGWLQDEQRARPRARLATVLADRIPAAVAAAWITHAGVDGDTLMAHVAREDRRRLAHALVETPLEVSGSRGYGYAEVTAGGVPLEEIDSATMQSRICQGLYLVGEVLDVDGRLGGFNFQWAWSSGWVAGRAVARAAARCP